MFNTLRSRLILSHVLPSLLIIPLMGLLLVYTLENRQILPSMSKDLGRDARLVAALTHDQARLWQDPAYAQELLKGIHEKFIERAMLLRPDGTLLASSDPADKNKIGQPVPVDGLSRVQAGQEVELVRYNQPFKAEAVDVMAPVIQDGQLVGIVRITDHIDSVSARLYSLRILIATILILGLVTSAALGAGLAITIANPIQRVTGAIRGVASSSRPEKLREGGPREIHTLLASVNDLVDRLENLEEARRQLLANLVHELGRPLGALRSAAKALERGAAKNPALFKQLIAGIDAELANLQNLLEDVSHLHEGVLGSLELARQWIQPKEWLQPLLAPWEQAAREKGLEWEARIPSGLPLIYADPQRLGQSLGNLLSNAVKYTPPGGKVSVVAGVQGDSLWIRVSDNGPGIPPAEQGKIFQPFYRGQGSQRFARGMGLGLSIARDLVAAHGGELELRSAPDSGSEFTVWISTAE